MSPKVETLPLLNPGMTRQVPSTAIRMLSVLGTLLVVAFVSASRSVTFGASGHSQSAAKCAQPLPLLPPPNPVLDAIFASQFSLSNTSYAGAISQRLSGIVQINSESFDDMKTPPTLPNDDPRRAGILRIHEYLRTTWPRVHATLSLEVINTYGLVYTWKGSDDLLKPVMVTAHMDTVPVDQSSLAKWTFPPFEGRIESGYVWGRGSADVKAQIVSIMDAVETLASNSFSPKRTILIAFGFDEEISGRQGAGAIAKHLEQRYGLHNIEFILDEGSSIESQYGASFALLSTGERGYLDIEVKVNTKGGHSSIPPDHTAIGYLAKAVSELEDHPYVPTISKDLDSSPFFNELLCGVEHGPNMEKYLKRAIKKASTSPSNKNQQQLVNLLVPNIKHKSLMTTTQAVDIIAGGVKVNALPEVATAIANYRIHPDESVASTESRIASLIKPLAKKYGLSFVQHKADGSVAASGGDSGPNGSISITTLADALEPSPITPTTGGPFQMVAGTIRHSMVRVNESLFVSPSLPTGNSDTRYFHGLSRHIFRFTALRDHDSHNIHTVDEKCSVADLVQSAGFFFELMRNADGDVF
ncbi:hypothetical protein HDU98_010274 [Podochytrium sp. JEL0797]|nr:hypothetical protein HDU98_010274 [Podochytrium sp. JEL0797]